MCEQLKNPQEIAKGSAENEKKKRKKRKLTQAEYFAKLFTTKEYQAVQGVIDERNQ